MRTERVVIVADDDEDLRDALVTVLREEGYDTRAARDGREALLLLDGLHGRPCILLLDLMMPNLSGFDVLEVLSQARRLDVVPVVVCSAALPAPDAPLPCGVRQCLPKPLCLGLLLETIADLCTEAPPLRSDVAPGLLRSLPLDERERT
jgi:CheY-like chemotaxis protein